LEVRRFWIELSTLLFVIVGAIWVAIQTKEMREANALARAANKISVDAIKASQRPWVGISKVETIGAPIGSAPNMQWTANITYENTGQSPATNVWTCWHQEVFKIDETPALNFNCEPKDLAPLSTLFPHASNFHTFLYTPTVDEAAGLRANTLKLLFWGHIKYSDGFKDQHESWCCFVALPTGANQVCHGAPAAY
jgi:hypothetical protein